MAKLLHELWEDDEGSTFCLERDTQRYPEEWLEIQLSRKPH